MKPSDVRRNWLEALLGEPTISETADLKISFSYAASERASVWEARTLSWPEVARRLTAHHQGEKRGSAIAPAIFRGKRRRVPDAQEVRMAALDSDKGAPFAEIVISIRALGIAAAVATTHTNGSTEFLVPLTAWESAKEQHRASPAESMAYRGYRKEIASSAQLSLNSGSVAITSSDQGQSIVRHVKLTFTVSARDA